MEWQSIETAPKDGTPVLVLMKEPGRLDGSRVQVAVEYPNGYALIGGRFAFDCPKPTHWMPLPPPPE